MRIASLQKHSFIDWEGKTVAVIFTKGCNFRCGYCHNPFLVLPHLLNSEPDISEKEIFDYLQNRKNWLDGIVIEEDKYNEVVGIKDDRIIKKISSSIETLMLRMTTTRI